MQRRKLTRTGVFDDWKTRNVSAFMKVWTVASIRKFMTTNFNMEQFRIAIIDDGRAKEAETTFIDGILIGDKYALVHATKHRTPFICCRVRKFSLKL